MRLLDAVASLSASIDRIDAGMSRVPPLFHPRPQAIVAGSRYRTLADAPDLYYIMAAEILFLIEMLERNAG